MMLKLGKHEMVILATLRKAAAENGLRIDCKTASAAMAARAQAYALGKKVRRHVERTPTDLEAEDLITVLDSISMSIDDMILVMRRKDQSTGLLAMQELLESTGTPVLDPMEEELAARARALMEKLSKEPGYDPEKGT